MYWEWKNNNSDYVGLMHYRRSLDFSQMLTLKEPGFTQWCLHSYPNEESLRKIGLNNEKAIYNSVTSCDILLSPPIKNPKTVQNNYQQYITADEHYQEHLDMCLEILYRLYPFLENYAKKYFFDKKRNGSHYSHVFVMRRDIFNEYCHLFFPLFFEIQKQIDYTHLTLQSSRVSAYFMERFLNIYIAYLKKEKLDINIGYSKNFIAWHKSDPIPIIEKPFESNCVSVAFSK